MNRDTTLGLLSDPTRRAVVAVLSRTDGLSRERLVELVAARTPGSATRERVRTELESDQLPRLAAAGVVECDAASVTPAARLADVAAHLPEADVAAHLLEAKGRDAAGGRPATDGRGSASDPDSELRKRLAGFYA